MFEVRFSDETVKQLKTEQNTLLSSLADKAKVSLMDVIQLLDEEKCSQQLRQSLLQDTLAALEDTFGNPIYKKQPKKKLSWSRKFLLGLGIAAGALNVICDAFGSISVLLSMIENVATAGFALLWASLGFALLCVGFFLIHQLALISKSTETPWLKVKSSIANYIEERRMLNALTRFLDTGAFITTHQKHGFTAKELQGLKALLIQRGQFLREKSLDLARARRGYFPMISRGLMVGSLGLWSLIGGFMFGFFALGMVMVLLPSVVIPIWGCVVFGVMTGLAALYVYCGSACKDVSQAVDRVIGADEESIQSLDTEETLDLVVFQSAQSEEVAPPEKVSANSALSFLVKAGLGKESSLPNLSCLAEFR